MGIDRIQRKELARPVTAQVRKPPHKVAFFDWSSLAKAQSADGKQHEVRDLDVADATINNAPRGDCALAHFASGVSNDAGSIYGYVQR